MKTIQYEKLPVISSVKYRVDTIKDNASYQIHACIDDLSWKNIQSNCLNSDIPFARQQVFSTLMLNIKNIIDEMLIYER